MNVERTIEFILEAQAKAEVRMAAHERRMGALDRRMDGVTKLIQQGMRLLVSFQKETDRKINALVDAQQVTEKKLQALINRQSRNGH